MSNKIAAVVYVLALLVGNFGSFAESTAVASPPQTLLWEGEHLEQLRNSKSDPTKAIKKSLKQLRKAADEALEHGPYSVMDKKIVPPSGDKHDYMSYSRYWWPNPDTQDSLPYIRRDGVVNRKLLSNGDRNRIGSFYDDFEALALAAYLIDADRYGPHAQELMVTWFLNPETKMNPNLNFAQAVPGVAEGRAPGVIDTRHFLRVIDGVILLESIQQVKPEEVEALRDWFSDFSRWMFTSKLGKKEQQAKNNHGAWFAAQNAGIALFIRDENLAKSIVTEVRNNRIGESIDSEGMLSEELKRTRSLHYTLFSLSAFATAARCGEHVGIDLWNHRADNGASLKSALDYVEPFLDKQEDWPHPSIERFAVSDRQSQLFYLASSRIDKRYRKSLDKAPKRYEDRHLAPLLFRASD